MTEQTANTMNQYLTFKLGAEIFALDISEVREVLEWTDITTIPRMPDYMRGVINLRGNAVPVMDLRTKLNMEHADITVDTCIIITEIELDDAPVLMGTMVDSVREVFEMLPEDIDPAPRMGNGVQADFIAGMGSQHGEFIIILDIDKILSNTELAEVRQVTDQAPPEPTEQAA